VGKVTGELYELALEVVSKDLPNRCPGITQGWRALLGGLPEHVAQAPRLFAGSVTNALYHLETTPGANPEEWIQYMLRLGALEPEVAALLEAGKVAAWRSGMAQYRASALDGCTGLSRQLCYTALGLRAEEDPLGLEGILQQLRTDPWVHPTAVLSRHTPNRELQLVARVGAFRGFGGAFLRPPRLTYAGGQFFASDGEACWAIHADVFGATLSRVGAQPPRAEGNRNGALQLDPNGLVRCGAYARLFPELRNATDAISDRATLAVTVPLSHAVYLVALTTPGKNP
jgi:hypothetical protein